VAAVVAAPAAALKAPMPRTYLRSNIWAVGPPLTEETMIRAAEAMFGMGQPLNHIRVNPWAECLLRAGWRP